MLRGVRGTNDLTLQDIHKSIFTEFYKIKMNETKVKKILQPDAEDNFVQKKNFLFKMVNVFLSELRAPITAPPFQNIFHM